MHQRSSVSNGRSLPTSNDVTSQWPGLVSSRTGMGNQWHACHQWHVTQYFGHASDQNVVCILFQNNKVHYEISRRNASDRSGVDVSTHVYHWLALVTSWTTVAYDAKFIHA
ncbi:hypothetical protein TNCV_1852501 [Trichonephila clavipes]|nr:hypothetical protein TNCV_1852501 [Trichonephila clavipes]